MKDFFASILNIFRWIGRALRLLRNTILNLCLAIIGIVALAAFFSTKPQPIKDNSLLLLDLSGDLVEEQRLETPFAELLNEILGNDGQQREIVLQEVLDAIDTAASDPKIRALLLKLTGLGEAGIDQLQAIGEALEAFKKSGKVVVAAEDYYSQKQYYLASFASTILLNPMGGVALHGFGAYSLYFQELLSKLQVNYHVFRVGQYKSAVEPLTRNSMSEEARQQNSQWLASLWQTFSSGIEQRRQLPEGRLGDYITHVSSRLRATGGDTATMALQAGLVDRLLTREEVRRYLHDLSGVPASSDMPLVALTRYLQHVEPSFVNHPETPSEIGIIVAEGAITGGKQPPGLIGSDSLAEMLRSARKKPAIKAVVLRINSGGGSAFAAEIIRQEMLALQQAGKRVVVSMGPVAASGAYWLAADADQIWAAPTTLTGSIGIFGAIPTFEKSLEKIGVHSDGVGTSELAAGLNLTQPLSKSLQESIQLSVEFGYRKFIDIVATGRKMETAAVQQIAEGRVFSGSTAATIGLVDKLGSLEDAIAAAAELAGLDDYSAAYVERPLKLRDQILHRLHSSLEAVLRASSTSLPLFQQLLHSLHKAAESLPFSGDPQHCYTHTLVQQPLR